MHVEAWATQSHSLVSLLTDSNFIPTVFLFIMRIYANTRIWLWESKNKLRRTLTHAARRLSRKQRIIVSLTSYPPRIATIHESIRSILAQKMLPDKVVLWLYEGDFPNREKDLPATLTHLLAHDVQIRWVTEDLKPHKKYYWALQEFTHDLVITFDDDMIYPNTYISELVAAHQTHPEAVVSIRTHLITFNVDGSLKPYNEWIFEAPAHYPAMLDRPSMRLFGTNGAGTLFPPHIMPPETFDMQAIRDTALRADDIWIKVMQVIGSIPVVSATTNQVISLISAEEARTQNRIGFVPNSQTEALWSTNSAGGNDKVIKQILAYPTIRRALNGDFADLVRDDSFDELMDDATRQ
ncbi:putative sugar transferase [Bifidobacterium reuteri DSM 23975]|uniref:Putative sugar transferase n=1 Tax=Bifidobacterium reuteri DSM 23975 TaxID=1437610 RepID=A0A087CMB8_9BIFI|nr:glycosyltransferase family A protein [Bifidobacterium reuteri]KFI84418.1 putative sugar transferase [Bifidobacterium reuteri DSM 23975]